MIDLSILVCGVYTRYDTFLPKIQAQLFSQYVALEDRDLDRVEIIILIDNKKKMLGTKRNELVDMAQGKYIVFVDDDDRIAEDYIQSLLDATNSDADCIVFNADVSINAAAPVVCFFSKDFKTDRNEVEAYYRVPNHICCVKRFLAVAARFPSIPYAEDAGYSKALMPMLNTEYKIDRVLYYYDYNKDTTEQQDYI